MEKQYDIKIAKSDNMESEKVDVELLLETCLLAGKILMESTAEMYRVEDTLLRIGRVCHRDIVSYTTQTGLFVGISGKSNLRMTQINKRVINLDKIAKVNELSRKFTSQHISLIDFLEQLKQLECERTFYNQKLEVLASAIISCGMMILFGGKLHDVPITFLIGGIGYILYLFIVKVFQIRFLAEFVACFMVGVLCILSAKYQFTEEIKLNVNLIGAVMPFVPGVVLTNAVRDLLAGHLLSGISRVAEGLITACAIGFGIAFAFQIFN